MQTDVLRSGYTYIHHTLQISSNLKVSSAGPYPAFWLRGGVVFVNKWTIQTSLCKHQRCSATGGGVRGHAFPGKVGNIGIKGALFPHSRPEFRGKKDYSFLQNVDLQPSKGGGSEDPPE